MDKLRIDDQKLMYHPKEVLNWKLGQFSGVWVHLKNIEPIYIEISPINICNSKCTFCGLDFFNNKDHKKYQLEPNKLFNYLVNIKPKSVMFGGSGEPTLWQPLSYILRDLKGIGIDCALTTNLTIDKDLEKYVKYCSWIKVSINGGTAKEYEKVHLKNDFDKVWKNIARLRYLKAKQNLPCSIGTQIVLLEDNFSGLENLIKLSKMHKLDYCVIKPYSQHLSSSTIKYKEITYSYFLKTCQKLKDIYDSENFEVIFRKKSMERWDKKEINFTKCWATPFFWSYIEADGNVYSCSCHIGNDKFVLGNINKDMPEEIWYGDKRKENYDYIQNKMDINKCRVNCRVASINEYLEKVIKDFPHRNFI